MKKVYNKFNLSILSLLLSFILFSQDFSHGIFILNEGGAGSNNSTLSFLSESRELENDVYATANPGMSLGDTAQGIGFNADKIYIAVNISHQVIVANRSNLHHIATISEGIENPRYIAFYDNKGYVTCWGDPTDPATSYVAVINLETNEVESTIHLSEGPEKIIEHDGKLYVAHKGGYNQGNAVSIIDPETAQVEEITVGDVPNSMQIFEDELYVLCSGNPSWSSNPTNGSLYKINLTTHASELIFPFPTGASPSGLSLDNGYFYFADGASIYRMMPNATSIPTETFIETPITGFGGAYGFNVIDGVIYVGDAGDFVSNGKTYTYDDEGNLLQTYDVGISPNGFYQNDFDGLNTIDEQLTRVQIYPNPAKNQFFVLPSNFEQLEIYDLTGKLVMTSTNSPKGIDINPLQTGIYLVKFRSGNQVITKKLIKQ